MEFRGAGRSGDGLGTARVPTGAQTRKKKPRLCFFRRGSRRRSGHGQGRGGTHRIRARLGPRDHPTWGASFAPVHRFHLPCLPSTRAKVCRVHWLSRKSVLVIAIVIGKLFTKSSVPTAEDSLISEGRRVGTEKKAADDSDGRRARVGEASRYERSVIPR